MKSFRYGNTTVDFRAWTGIASGSTKSSETIISGSGGGGYVGPRGGYVSAPSIHSTVIRKHEFWLTTEDGKEQPFRVGGPDIPLKDGQKVTVITGYPKGQDMGWNVLLYNYSAEQYWFILSPDEIVDCYRFAGRWGWQQILVGFLLMGLMVLVFPNAVAGFLPSYVICPAMVLVGLVLGILYLFVSIGLLEYKREGVANDFRDHVWSLLCEILNNNS